MRQIDEVATRRNNADGYALYYYGPSLATQNYGWGLSLNNDSANATAAEFAPSP